MPSPSSTTTAETRLPRRDWILLPLIGLLTIVAVCAATESVARHIYTEFDAGSEQCPHFTDPYIGIERNASCAYRRKTLESDVVDYRLNSRGYRDDTEVTPKQPGVFRIVLVGSSFGYGGAVDREQSIAGVLPTLLSQQLGRKVELYNVSVPGFPGLPQSLNRRFADALDAQPDLVLWVLTRWDIKSALDAPDAENGAGEAADAGHQTAVVEDSTDSRSRGLPRGIREALASLKQGFMNSRSAYLLQQLLCKSQSQYLKRSLMGPDEINGYLHTSLSNAWRNRLDGFDESVAAISGKASAAHVLLAVARLPSGVEATMISMGEWPAGYDPYLLTKEVDQIVARRGAIPLDVTTGFRDVPHPERDYFPVDGHANVVGNVVLAQLLAEKLESSGLVPRNSAAAQAAPSQESPR
jgi:hypothetical protein